MKQIQHSGDPRNPARLLSILSLTLLLILAGCVATKKGVKKSDPGESGFPASRFMTAKGIGQTEEEARRQAKAELSNIFESRVVSNTFSKIKTVLDTEGNESLEKRVESNIRVVSSLRLKGMRIGKTWFDQESKLHHAIAVLPRHQARENWQHELDDLDNAVEGELRAMNDRKSRLMKLKSLRKIQNLWIKREVIASRIRVLGFDDAGFASYEIQPVFHLIPEIKASILIFVKIEGDHAQWVDDQISGAVSSAGIALVKTKEEANVYITGTVKTEPVTLDNPDWKFARAVISLSVMDAEQNVTAEELSDNTRAGHLNYKEAVTRAVKKVSVSIAKKLIAFFNEGA